MSYLELPIHQKITAKANAIHFYYHHRTTPGGVLRAVSKKDPQLYCPAYPAYAIRYKTNAFDLNRNQEFA